MKQKVKMLFKMKMQFKSYNNIEIVIEIVMQSKTRTGKTTQSKSFI